VSAEDDPVEEFPRELVVPLFPMSSTIVFPRVRQAFDVVDPGARTLLREVLDGDGLIGFPLLLRRGPSPSIGTPQMAEVLGVGCVVDYDTRNDGTSRIEVLGRWRARLVADAARSKFRRAKVTILPETELDDADARALHEGLCNSVRRLDQTHLAPDAKNALDQILRTSSRDVPFLVHLLCTVVVGNLEVRQKLLEEDKVLDRGRALLTILDTLSQELGPPTAEE
jgi:Lon protease-like protein